MKKNLLLFCCSCFFCLTCLATPVDFSVEIDDISSFSLNTLGSHNKLKKDLWQASDPQTLFQLIDKIGTAPLSPASRKAIITLLTQDTTGFELKNSQENSFLLKKLEALTRLGAFNEALELIELIPTHQIPQEILQLKTNLLIALGQFEKAKKEFEKLNPSFKTDETRINFFLEKEEKNKAILSYEIYRENQEGKNPLFSALAENILLELETEIPNSTPLNIEHVYLFSRLKNPSLKLDNQYDGIRKIFVNLPTSNIDERIYYAEKINLDAHELENIYKLPLFDLKIESNHLRRAEIYQKIKSETDHFAKVEWLKTFIKIALQDKLGLYLAPLIEQELNTVLPQKEYKDLAFYAAQIYILQNNLEKANEWYQILSNEKDDAYQKHRLLLIPGMQKLGAGIPAETESLLNHFCADLKKENCSEFWQKASHEFYETLNTSKPNRSPLMIFEYLKQEHNLKTGENLIRAILDLNDEKISDKYSLLFFIKQNCPLEISLPLELEGTLYQ